MLIDFTTISPSAVYHTMTQTIVPRPIAWVLSVNANGTFNLAPFSYFNAIASDPPLCMISVGTKPNGGDKDTAANIKERNYFTIHLPHVELIEAVEKTSQPLPAGESELSLVHLTLTNFANAPLPRIAECRVAFACSKYAIHSIGSSAQSLILGKISSVYIDDTIARIDDKNRLTVNSTLLNPLARLGRGEYSQLGDLLRPKKN